MDALTSERSALFLQKGMGEQPMFRGLHAFTGDMTKADGTITPIYYFASGRPVKGEETRTAPEPVSVTLDASLQSIGDLVGSRFDCPIHFMLAADSCLPADSMRSWGRWAGTEPQVMLLISDAKIEQRALSNLMARESGQNMPMGSVTIKFDNWSLIRGGNEVAIEAVLSATTFVGVTSSTQTGCDASNLDGADACRVWYAAAANGSVRKRDADGAWSSILMGTRWAINSGGIYVDNRFLLVGGSDGAASPYGVMRSTNGGATWQKISFATSPGGIADAVRQILRYNDDFFAFTSSGVWRSADSGKSWTRAMAGSILHAAFDCTGLGIGVNQSKVWVSRNAGLRWNEVSAFGGDQKDIAFAGGYVHIVDSVSGYARANVDSIRNGTQIEWSIRDTVAGVTRVAFVNSLIGYRLRGPIIERTLSGGYSWEPLSLDDTASSFTDLALCAGRLGVIGETYFGFYSPFFDQTE